MKGILCQQRISCYSIVNNVLGWLVFAVAAATYLLTMEPTASFWDCGEFISSAYKLEVGHPPGAPFFMLTANLFTRFASDPSQVAVAVNAMSALSSALTILFLFWSITRLLRRMIVVEEETISLSQIVTIMGAGLIGTLVYTFSDTFWFSAVEGEVYAYSSLFTAVVFWLILKWEEVADSPQADRWLVLIAYLMGLSVGVHLLNLLCIPAIVLVYYYRKRSNPTIKGMLIAVVVSFAIVALMMYGVVQGLVEVCGWFELFFVNVLGMSYNSGVFAYVFILGVTLTWAIWETMRMEVNVVRSRVSFILSVTLLGIPFMGDGLLFGILLIVGLTIFLFRSKTVAVGVLNTILVSLTVIFIGYASYALILIRATADTPMNQNSPKDIFTLRTYLAREQYGTAPLLYGRTYVSEVKRENRDGTCVAVVDEGAPTWSRIIKKGNEKDRYYVSHRSSEVQYMDELMTIFPRMYSPEGRHVPAYKIWADVKGEPVRINRCGNVTTVMKPTFAENLRFFFAYQLNFMYFRYFMWNFSGRQNDIQGHGEIMNGNWITGIPFIDEALVGPQDNMPTDISDNKSHNTYFLLPLLLGIMGILYQLYAGKCGVQRFWITFFLFFMTGIAIVLYLNQTPFQPRERDYAYAASFYAFCIWVGFGVVALTELIKRYLKVPGLVAAVVATLLALPVPARMASENWDDHDRSLRYFARDFGANYLESCEPDAVLFTNGDNDTFPLWYVQEVEGIRTDVRVCNTSYLQTDWYISQMKKDAYDSKSLPVSWELENYIQGTRDFAYVIPRLNQPLDLLAALNFVKSNDPKNKRVPEYRQALDYIPTKTLTYRVDTAAALASGVITESDLPFVAPEMIIDLDGKDVLGKQELAILDMLQTNNWKRPIYYAITVSSDQYVHIDPYFRQTGLAYLITPMRVNNTVKSVDADRMFDNLMNKFRWGGLETKGVYLDENVMRMAKSYRSALFGRLANILAYQGDNERALQVLDKGMEVIPPYNVSLDESALSFAELYYQLGQTEKAEEIHEAIIANAFRNLDWFRRLRPVHRASVFEEMKRNLAIAQEVLRVGEYYNPDFVAKHKATFDSYNTFQ
jgi:tetratricopeptide (TPR) repeat protein